MVHPTKEHKEEELFKTINEIIRTIIVVIIRSRPLSKS